ncbi:hypothetical protein, partial [Streptomyces anandii]|uniref:hypothetical protein n=1 Tax=Streptomyces anandii TaxID=285454 RepID=UPI001671B511
MLANEGTDKYADDYAIKEMIAHLKWVIKSGQEWVSEDEFNSVALAGNGRLSAHQMIKVLAEHKVIEQPETIFHYEDEYKVNKERCAEFFHEEGLGRVYDTVSARHSAVAHPAHLAVSGVDRGLAGESQGPTGAASAMTTGAEGAAAERMVAYLQAALDKGSMSTMALLG